MVSKDSKSEHPLTVGGKQRAKHWTAIHRVKQFKKYGIPRLRGVSELTAPPLSPHKVRGVYGAESAFTVDAHRQSLRR